ncbi:hypothetical protein LCGC14_1769830, partial [marine sediment metagenome]
LKMKNFNMSCKISILTEFEVIE